MSEEADDQTLVSVGFNPRFPNTNQTDNCFANYMEFQRCAILVPEDDREDVCAKFERGYKHLCPMDWVEKWDEQIQNGTFPAQDYLQELKR